MNDPILGSSASHDRFDHIEAMLTSYPQVSDEEIDRLKRWFTKEATAFDVASLASKPACEVGYRRFRADHVDRFTAKDWVVFVLAITVLSCAIAAGLVLAA